MYLNEKSQSNNLKDFLVDIKSAPFIRLLFPFLVGIVLQSEYHFISSPYPICFFAFILCIIFYFLSKKYSYRFLFGFGVCFLFFSFGITIVEINNKKSIVTTDEKNTYKIIIETAPEIRERNVKFEGRIIANCYDTSVYKINEKCIVYINANKTNNYPCLGDIIICNTKLEKIQPPKNVGEFNYAKYMERQGFYTRAYLYYNDYEILSKDQLVFYKKIPIILRQEINSLLSKAGLTGDELAVATALTVGDRQYIDKELEDAYILSGSIHLLAVSGMHVAILFMVFNFMFGFANKNSKSKLIKNIVILLLLWFYSAVAGFSPSVVRSAFMFSVFLIGEMSAKQKNKYNNLAFSCFVICIINPNSIYDIGFQLSYLALLGIMFFQPKFKQMINLPPGFLGSITDLLTTTMAAQIAVMPVLLFTFKQFPLYFLAVNVFLVPLTTFVMYASVVLLLFTWQPFLLKIIGSIYALLIKAMNSTVIFFNSLPYSSIDIYINKLQFLLIILLILLFTCFLYFRKSLIIYPILVCAISIFSVSLIHKIQVVKHKEIGVLATNDSFYSYFIKNGSGFTIRDSINKNFDYYNRNKFMSMGFNSEKDLLTFSVDSLPMSHNGIISFEGMKIALSSKLKYCEDYNGNKFLLDFLIIDHKSDVENILKCYKPELIIIPPNIHFSHTKKWEKIAESIKIKCYNINESGAWYFQL